MDNELPKGGSLVEGKEKKGLCVFLDGERTFLGVCNWETGGTHVLLKEAVEMTFSIGEDDSGQHKILPAIQGVLPATFPISLHVSRTCTWFDASRIVDLVDVHDRITGKTGRIIIPGLTRAPPGMNGRG